MGEGMAGENATRAAATPGRHLLLGGMMGAGKSTAGALVAERLGLPFVDLDRAIEQATSQSIASLFREGGEPGFRVAERAVLDRLLRSPGRVVISLGGGTLLERAYRLRVLASCTVLTLHASPATLAARLDVSRETRPLLPTDPSTVRATLERLLEERAGAYSEAHAQVSAEGSVGSVVEAILAEAQRPAFGLVAAGAASYRAYVGRTLDPLDAEVARLLPTAVHVVTDENVARLAPFVGMKRIGEAGHPTVLRAGEAHKTTTGTSAIWDDLLARGVDRSGMVLAVGGGVVTDMGGYAAATWHRGIRWIAVPTTLLGMVDASVGGKTGVDHGPAKNAVGAFHPPSAVVADVSWLRSEPERSYRSGLAELVKTALVARPLLLESVLSDSAAWAGRDLGVLEAGIFEAVAAKAEIVSRDPYERGERAVLNLGHTLGHALESAGGFSRYTHGEAVALGTLAALRVGATLGHTAPELAAAVASLFARLKLPTTLDPAHLEAALPLVGMDKKRHGNDVRYVVVDQPGQPRVVRLPIGELAALLRSTAEPAARQLS